MMYRCKLSLKLFSSVTFVLSSAPKILNRILIAQNITQLFSV